MGGEAAGDHDGGGGQAWSGMRAAAGVGTVTERTVEFVEPTEKSLVAWDHKLLGFGVRVQPSGTKSFIVCHRTSDGGRDAPNDLVSVNCISRQI